MTKENVKKALAGIGLAAFIASIGFIQIGCSQTESEAEKPKSEAAAVEEAAPEAADTTAQEVQEPVEAEEAQ